MHRVTHQQTGSSLVSVEIADARVTTGKTLPILDISDGGEISVNESSIIKRPWNSKCLEEKGKVQLIQYIAANRKAIGQNKPFTQSLMQKGFSPEQLDTTIIVHMANTFAITRGIAAKKIANNKIKHDYVNFVIDDKGIGLARWGMKPRSSAIIVLDADGKVLFAKDGPLSDLEIKSTLELIENQMS